MKVLSDKKKERSKKEKHWEKKVKCESDAEKESHLALRERKLKSEENGGGTMADDLSRMDGVVMRRKEKKEMGQTFRRELHFEG